MAHRRKTKNAADAEDDEDREERLEQVRDRDQDPGRQRQRAAEVGVDRLELRDDQQEHRGRDDRADDEHDDRVGHRRLHLAPQLDLLLDRVGEPHEHRVEHTAGLTGLHHRDVEVVEHLRVLRQRGGERRAALDVEPHLAARPWRAPGSRSGRRGSRATGSARDPS